MEDLVSKGFCKFAGSDVNRFQYAVGQVESVSSRGFSKLNAARRHVRKSSHLLRDAAATRVASWHFDYCSFGVGPQP